MKIKISEIENTFKKEQNINFCEKIEEFNKDVPVKADLKIKIQGEIIKISGRINAVLNLTCDVCLKDFTKIFDFKVEEYYIKDKLNNGENRQFELVGNSFAEDLNGCDEIDITDFIYQSVILQLPNKIVCDINCNGNENVNRYIKNGNNSFSGLEILMKEKKEKE